MPEQRKRGGLCRLTLMMMVSWLWLGAVGVEGGILEDGTKTTGVVVNAVHTKGATPPVCISTEYAGVVPCDTDPRCCQKDSPRVKDTTYCCPPGAYQYHYKLGQDDMCACAVHV
ncbi:uncharacterized protein LOC143300623 [Babylonia areolata]|uniref:uncharacterized protein LOC143300623 n=1 Tax=Babylonia areolata TaxID=304850 RepID=UPI003FD26C92